MYQRILQLFPNNLSFCFAYGSGVKKQANYGALKKSNALIDLVFCPIDSQSWHEANLVRNWSHYSTIKHLGSRAITKYQTDVAAKVFCNTLVPIDDRTRVKYCLISEHALRTDLLEWRDLYIAGRLHKPVEILRPNSKLESALNFNLASAVRTSLLLLPEKFSVFDLYHKIASLSYDGDFRMIFGENKNKVRNIVSPQIEAFQSLYAPVLTNFDDHLQLNTGSYTQSKDPDTIRRLLNELPSGLIERLEAKRGGRSLESLASDPSYPKVVDACVRDIVWQSSIKQSLKNIITAGMLKSSYYSWQKVLKMFST